MSNDVKFYLALKIHTTYGQVQIIMQRRKPWCVNREDSSVVFLSFSLDSPCCTYRVSVMFLHEPCREKTYVLVPIQTGCTATEDGKRLEILDLESRGIVLSM